MSQKTHTQLLLESLEERREVLLIALGNGPHPEGTAREVVVLGKLNFQKMVNKLNIGSPDECWEHGGSPKQYGRIGITGANLGVHRIMCVLHHGMIKSSELALHKCDNVKCCNPNHLFVGTQKDNMQDASKKKRLRDNGTIWECLRKRRLQKGEGSATSKLTNSQAEEIMSHPRTRGYCVKFSKKFGVSVSTISKLRTGVNWRHLSK